MWKLFSAVFLYFLLLLRSAHRSQLPKQQTESVCQNYLCPAWWVTRIIGKKLFLSSVWTPSGWGQGEERSDGEGEGGGNKAWESGMETDEGEKEDLSRSSVSSLWQLRSLASFSPCNVKMSPDCHQKRPVTLRMCQGSTALRSAGWNFVQQLRRLLSLVDFWLNQLSVPKICCIFTSHSVTISPIFQYFKQNHTCDILILLG